MKALRCLLVLPVAFAFLALTLASGPATASVVTYRVSGSFGNGATFLPGSFLTIDTTAGTVSLSDLLVSAGNNPSPPNTFTDANLFQDGSFQTPFDWRLADGTDLTMFAGGATEFQGFSPSGGTVGLVTYFGPWGFSNGSSDTVLTPAATPLPAALPLFASGLAALGLLGWRRKRKPAAIAN